MYDQKSLTGTLATDKRGTVAKGAKVLEGVKRLDLCYLQHRARLAPLREEELNGGVVRSAKN